MLMAITLSEVSVMAALQVASAVCGAAPTNAPVDIEFTCIFKPEEGEEVRLICFGRSPLVTIVVEHQGHRHVFLTGPTEESLSIE